MNVTIYTKTQCRQCDFTKKVMNKHGASYNEESIEDNPEALAFVKSLGYLSAPVVVVTDVFGTVVRSWSGFRPDDIEQLAHAPALVIAA